MLLTFIVNSRIIILTEQCINEYFSGVSAAPNGFNSRLNLQNITRLQAMALVLLMSAVLKFTDLTVNILQRFHHFAPHIPHRSNDRASNYDRRYQ